MAYPFTLCSYFIHSAVRLKVPRPNLVQEFLAQLTAFFLAQTVLLLAQLALTIPLPFFLNLFLHRLLPRFRLGLFFASVIEYAHAEIIGSAQFQRVERRDPADNESNQLPLASLTP